MDRDARMLALLLGFSLAGATATADLEAAPPRASSGRISVRWIGQDGQDYVGPNNRPEPSDVQDIHLSLGGLDPSRQVAFVDVTGHGGDQWHYNQQSFAWKAELKRTAGASTADLFIEPARIEKGRSFHIVVRYDDGRTLESDFRGLTASPRARMPNATLNALWIGQEGSDWTSTGPSVGPDGLQDVCIRLAGISTRVAVRSLAIEQDGGACWEYGINSQAHHNAELIVDPQDRSQGSLYLQPVANLRGKSLKLYLVYVNETVDACKLSASACDPKLTVTGTPLPALAETIAAKWVGQDEESPIGPGAVHLTLGGLETLKPIVGAVLTDSVQGSWIYRADRPEGRAFHVDDFSEPLLFRPRPGGAGEADLFFAPNRDEAGANLTLRLICEDGSMAVARFKGGSCDPGRRIPRPDGTRFQAKPGDDLQEMVNRGGTVVLAPGTYRLSRPLVLEKPVTITSEGGATLLFSQGEGEPPWTTAVKIHRSHTTLDRLTVRFEGPVRWNTEVSYGPAVIGATDNFDVGNNDPKFNVTVTRLDLESSPPAEPRGWAEAVRLMRLKNVRSGRIAGNTLCGGPIEFFDGPWRIEDNRSRGTIPGTSSPAVFAGHWTHDLVLKRNRAEQQGPGGKTWRFLVLTVRGANDLISGNTIEGIGPRDDDIIPWANAPEMILTESYQLTYEGKVMGLSKDARLLRIGRAQGYPARTGGVVALLNGPGAGTWRRIAQAIDATTYLLDEPMPPETGTVSIAAGFVGETFEHNTIDTRGGKRSVHFVLAGNHYGTRVTKNYSLGAEDAFSMTACPTEAPMIWGWSHAPFLGGEIADNVFEDSAKGGVIGVEHNRTVVKTSRGRVYMTARVDRNVFRWSDRFAAQLARSGLKGIPAGLTIGISPSLDPGELRVHANGNRVEVPPSVRLAPILAISAADFNSRRIVDGKFRFAGDPSFDRQGKSSPAADARGSRPSR